MPLKIHLYKHGIKPTVTQDSIKTCSYILYNQMHLTFYNVLYSSLGRYFCPGLYFILIHTTAMTCMYKQAGFAEPHSSSTIGWVEVGLRLG